jgi:hypothetical protein
MENMRRVGLTRVVGKKHMLLKVIEIVDCIIIKIIMIIVGGVVVVMIVLLLILWLCYTQKKE